MCQTALLLAVALVCAPAYSAVVSPLASRGYAVIPQPREVKLTGRDFRFGPDWHLEPGAGVKADDAALEVLRERTPVPSKANGTAVRLLIDEQIESEEGYRLELTEHNIAIAARSAPGLLYGAETLVQLLKPQGGSLWLPEGVITDSPDLPMRWIYWDDAHHLEKFEELKRAVKQ